MNPDNKYQQQLEEAEPSPTSETATYEKKNGFSYRQAIGELIYAMITCRPDISYAVIKLSQYSTKANILHYDAIKQIYRYLIATKDDGIYFWRKQARNDLPEHPLPKLKIDSNYDENSIQERKQNDIRTIAAAVDSDWAGDKRHRRSVTGIIIKLAGGPIVYKTKYQDTIALSSTEAEFIAAAEAGKHILHVRSILTEIGLDQTAPTILYEDNQGALLMANAQQPTQRTRHMDIKHFVLQDWVVRDLLLLARIATADNYSDVMTKAQARTLFYRHMQYVQGKHIPDYAHNMIAKSDTFDTVKSEAFIKNVSVSDYVENVGGCDKYHPGMPRGTRDFPGLTRLAVEVTHNLK
jgi:hypothetical protein